MTGNGQVGVTGRGSGVRVGLFGLLGTGNIGNDASMEVVLNYLRRDHPGAAVDAICPGPAELTRRYGIPAVSLWWHHRLERSGPRPARLAMRVLAKAIDAVRIASWVRDHDVVIVPGMGVLEASLPMRPWETPYGMFVLSAAGKLFGTKIALVSVGATVISQRMTRWLFDSAARLAAYRSYRDVASRDAMTRRGLDTTADSVCPDLVYAAPAPQAGPADPATVAIGVMDFHGTNDDRRRAADIHAAYVEVMTSFIEWLLSAGRNIRILVGDRCDDATVREILEQVRRNLPDLPPARVAAEPISSFRELTEAMSLAGAVVATRFHNVMCALKLAKPVISLGYAPKNIAIMTDAGLAEFCQDAGKLELDRLRSQFAELELRFSQLRPAVLARNSENALRIERQFAELSELLFPARPVVPVTSRAERKAAAAR